MADTLLTISKDDIAESSLMGLMAYNLNEIRKHKQKEDIWIILNGRVYDITNILGKHPGGVDIVLNQIQINQNLTAVFYKMMHSVDALSLLRGHCIGTVDKAIIEWGDLFSVKIEILDNQHQNLLNIMNKIYCNGNINDLNEFIAAWAVHCETEEYFMKTYNFCNDRKDEHIKDHEQITTQLQSVYNDLIDKHKHKLMLNSKQTDTDKTKNKNEKNDTIESKKHKNDARNENVPFKCQELIDFCINQMGITFKKHAFHYDSLYIDKLVKPDIDASHDIKTEKDDTFGYIKPVFPNNQ